MKVLLADDHELVRDGLKPILQRLAPDTVVLEAETFHRAIDIVTAEPELGLAILDLKMPGMNGYAGLHAVRGRNAALPMVVLSGSVSRTDVLGSMQAGAAAYIPKTTGGPAILNALRLVLCGEKYFPPELLGAPSAAPRPAPAADGGLFGGLAEREQEVLRLVFDGLANKEIARELAIEEVTVKKRLSRIYRQLGVENRVQLLLLTGKRD